MGRLVRLWVCFAFKSIPLAAVGRDSEDEPVWWEREGRQGVGGWGGMGSAASQQTKQEDGGQAAKGLGVLVPPDF